MILANPEKANRNKISRANVRAGGGKEPVRLFEVSGGSKARARTPAANSDAIGEQRRDGNRGRVGGHSLPQRGQFLGYLHRKSAESVQGCGLARRSGGCGQRFDGRFDRDRGEKRRACGAGGAARLRFGTEGG